VVDENRALPVALAPAHRRWEQEFHHWHDFEPGDEFEGLRETTEWWHDYTNNPAAGVAPFRVFGRDSSGGMAAFWLREPEAPVESQPIVFHGSEGELVVIARDLSDYLWLLASGVGPLEVVFGLHREPELIPALVDFAEQHAQPPPRTAEAVTSAAAALLPALEALIESVGRYERSAPRPPGMTH
jgi:hypothetical protein